MYRQMSFHTHVFLIKFFVLFQIKPRLPPSVNNFGELRFSHAAFCLLAAVLIFLRPREMKKFLCDETYNILLSIGAVPQRWALRRFENMPHSMSNQCLHVAYGQWLSRVAASRTNTQPEIEKWNCESLENKPGPNVLQCHYRITLPSDADYTCTGCIFCARHRDRLVPLEKPIRRGVLITQCIRKLLMGNCTPGALFATFRRRIEEWPSGERDGCKSNWAWLIECRGTDYYIVVCIYAV